MQADIHYGAVMRNASVHAAPLTPDMRRTGFMQADIHLGAAHLGK